MADQPEVPVVLQPIAPPAGGAESEPPPSSPVKAMAKWFRNKTSSKDKDSLKSIKSQMKHSQKMFPV